MNKSSLQTFLEDKIFLGFCAFFTVIFFYLSQSSTWVETEVFPVHSSKYLFSAFQYEFLFSLKPLFYFVLKISLMVSEYLNTLPMTNARILFALNGLAILALMYHYIKQKTNSYHASLAVILLAGSYVFLERGFRVRSDLLCSFVSLLILLIHLKVKSSKKYYGILGLLFSLFLITPKSLYWFGLTTLLLFNDSHKKNLAPYVLKILSVFLMVWTLLSFLFQDPFFIKSFQESGLFFKQSAQNSWNYLLSEGLIASLYNRSHIGHFAENNLFLVGLILANIFFLIPFSLKTTSSVAQKGNKNSLWLNRAFLFLLLVLLLHPEQKMFFLCSLMPFFILLFFTHPKWFVNFETHTRKGFKLAVLIFALSYSSFSVLKFQYQHSNKNFTQKSVLKDLNSFYKKAEIPLKIFDPLCLISSIKTDCKYLDSSVNIKEYLKLKRFDVIIPSYGVSDWDILSLRFNSFEYILLKNKIYYKAFVRDFKNQPRLYASYLKSRSGLSGKKIFKDFLESLPLDSLPYKSKKYFYLYVSAINQPLDFQAVKDCPQSIKSKKLQAGCYYTKSQIQEGILPAKKEKLALFYTARPPHLKSKKSLRYLFKYDQPSY